MEANALRRALFSSSVIWATALLASSAGFTATIAASSPTPLRFLARVERHVSSDMNHYGVDVAIDGQLAVVGSSTPDYRLAPGSAYVYDFADPQNIKVTRLLSGTESQNNLEKFGQSVAVTGSLVFVGAPNASSDSGIVHMFDLSDPQNVKHKKIVAFDSAPQGQFGWSLAVDGERLIVGSPDFSALVSLPPAVYILNISDPDNITQQKIVPDPSNNVGRFGEYVDIDGDFLVVGDFDDNERGNFKGAAYLYNLSDLNNIQGRKLFAHDSNVTRAFGRRVAISGETALVFGDGDLGQVDPPGPPSGVVYAHDFADWNNVSQSEFAPVTLQIGDRFGRDIAFAGSLAIIGSTGGPFVYDLSDPTSPVNLGRLPFPNGVVPPGFGATIAFDGRTAIVSSSQEGAAYLFVVVPEPRTSALSAILLPGWFLLTRCCSRRSSAPLTAA